MTESEAVKKTEAVGGGGSARETVKNGTNDSKENQKLSSFGLARLYSRVDISADKWLLSQDQLRNSPSQKDGLDEQTELELRYLGCELIQAAAVLLKLSQVAAATAQILYQRYFYQKSFIKFNFEVKMALFYIADFSVFEKFTAKRFTCIVKSE